jgi:hypothetical protein
MADKHDEARELADKGLDEIIGGNRKKGEDMIRRAKELDPDAVSEVEREAEEDAEQARHYEDSERKSKTDDAQKPE